MANKRPNITTLSVPPALKKEARVMAIRSGVSLSEAVRRFLAAWVAGDVELPDSVNEEVQIEKNGRKDM